MSRPKITPLPVENTVVNRSQPTPMTAPSFGASECSAGRHRVPSRCVSLYQWSLPCIVDGVEDPVPTGEDMGETPPDGIDWWPLGSAREGAPAVSGSRPDACPCTSGGCRRVDHVEDPVPTGEDLGEHIPADGDDDARCSARSSIGPVPCGPCTSGDSRTSPRSRSCRPCRR